ncbi:hypothetical protein D921_00587 [Enterococcus faecalis F01966]|nr:hypothetical protein D921_00587 [Enterococcus faecalis F01966]
MFHFNTKHQKAIAENFLSSILATQEFGMPNITVQTPLPVQRQKF